MNEYGGELLTLADHFGKFRAIHGDLLRRLFADHVSRPGNQPGIWLEAGDVASSPSHDLATAASLFDVNEEMTAKDNVKTRDWTLPEGQNGSGSSICNAP